MVSRFGNSTVYNEERETDRMGNLVIACVVVFSHYSIKYDYYSLESPRQGRVNEYPQHVMEKNT